MHMARAGLGIIVAMLFLIVSPAAADDSADYALVLIGGKKVGYAVHTRISADGKVTTTDTMSITISRSGTPMAIQQYEQAVETPDGRPIAFKSLQTLGALTMQAEGRIDDAGQVVVLITSGGQTQNKSFAWPKAAVMSEGLLLQQQKQGLKEGTTYVCRQFMPSMLEAMELDAKVGATQDVDLLGRVLPLAKVVTTTTTPAGKFAVTSYVDKQCHAQKTVMAMLGMDVEIIACTKDVATAKLDMVDMMGKAIVRSPVAMKDIASIKSATYTLTLTDKHELNLPATTGQSVSQQKDGTLTVTVGPTPMPRGDALPYKGKDPVALEALKPTRYLQSGQKEVLDLAHKSIGDTKDAGEAASRIETFVRQYITKKDLSVGYATAADVVQSKQGDCTEHAILTAAMCQAVGIPAQVVAGIVYVPKWGSQQDVFVPHAWTQVMIGDHWVALDSALSGFDAGHIALCIGNGEPEKFFGTLLSLGYLTVTKVDVAR